MHSILFYPLSFVNLTKYKVVRKKKTQVPIKMYKSVVIIIQNSMI